MWTLNLIRQTTLILCPVWWYCFCSFRTPNPSRSWSWFIWCYVIGFNQFEQYLAKHGKKQPKAESVITEEFLKKHAKEIKQAKLEEFRSCLDFTAMTFRDKRRHKIDNYVTGRWVLTIKVDKDGQFKKFKARWVCRGFQDAQTYDLQTDSLTAVRYGFRVASQHAASMYWDLLHLDLKTAFLHGELRPPRYPCAVAYWHWFASLLGWFMHPLRLWTCGRTSKMVEKLRQISEFTWPTRADRCTCVCFEGALKKPKQVSFADSEAAEPALLRGFISLFWLKKDCFQLVISKPNLETEEGAWGEEGWKLCMDYCCW